MSETSNRLPVWSQYYFIRGGCGAYMDYDMDCFVLYVTRMILLMLFNDVTYL
jgi:hypothetical protein